MAESSSALKRNFIDFIETDFSWGSYKSKIDVMIFKRSPRLLLNIDDLRIFNEQLTRNFQRNPNDYLPVFEIALAEYIGQKYKEMKQQTDVLQDLEPLKPEEIHIGVEGNMGEYHVTPRQLLANFLGSLIAVEGIVTRCSIVLPKVVKTIHFCPSTGKFLHKSYSEQSSIQSMQAGFSHLSNDPSGNSIETEFGLSVYKDTQTLYIQEMPERAPPGQLPRSVECTLEDDLVDKVKPGDRVRVVGIYRASANKSNGILTGVMRTVLVVNHVTLIGHQNQNCKISDKDMENIRNLSKNPKVFDMLSTAIAPSIFGHQNVKKALLLQLLGGVEKMAKGTHIRGDVNVLLVGDPSTAKSQMLRFMLHIAPLSISTSGRASTGVGLTAAVVSDKHTGERTLQAGAMVLADRGVVCIDEFDKMNDIDRVALHEVMEQQKVTIAKAGIQTSLNARCSVLAAANPIYGQYNRAASIQRNVGLPDSLLSRFDLVFILLDENNPRIDRAISDHVMEIHQYRSKEELLNENSSECIGDMSLHTQGLSLLNDFDEDKLNEDDDEEAQRIADMLNSTHDTPIDKPLFSTSFLKKYLLHAKKAYHPVLTNDAVDLISEKYCSLRKNNGNKTLPITARTLETIIRLSSAHAKCRLSKEVTTEDVEIVFSLMQYAICFMSNAPQSRDANSVVNSNQNPLAQDSLPLNSQNKHVEQNVQEEEQQQQPMEEKRNNVEEVLMEQQISQTSESSMIADGNHTKKQTNIRKRTRTDMEDVDEDCEEEEDEDMGNDNSTNKNESRFDFVKDILYQEIKKTFDNNPISVGDIREKVNTALRSSEKPQRMQPFSQSEMEDVVQYIVNKSDGMLMYENGEVFPM